MSKFDPYHKWLAIPPEQQPAHHYKLLGLNLFEDDPDVIETSADRQMAHVRSYQMGQRAEFSQQLLNEISAAKVELLDPKRKAAYDKQLKAKAKKNAPKPAAKKKLVKAEPIATPVALPSAGPVINSKSTTHRSKKSSSMPVLLIGVGVLLMLIMIGSAVAILGRSDTPVADTSDSVVDDIVSDETVSDDTVDTPTPTESGGLLSSPSIPPVDPSVSILANSVSDPDPVKPEPVKPEPVAPTPEEKQPVTPPVASEPQEVEKSPLPSRAARDAAREEVVKLLSLEASDTPTQKEEQASSLLSTANDPADSPASLFAMLNIARELATAAGKTRLAFEAIGQLESNFEFDVSSVRIDTIETAIEAKIPLQAKEEVVEVGIELVDDLFAQSKYESASKLGKQLTMLARRMRSKSLTDELVMRGKLANQLVEDHQRSKVAFAKLEENPDDPAANLIAGKFHLFTRGDWATALPLLAKGSDRKLSFVAQAEISEPNNTQQQLKLADDWRDWATSQNDKTARAMTQAHALAWYSRAEQELSGLPRERVRQRIGQLTTDGVEPADLDAEIDRLSRGAIGRNIPTAASRKLSVGLVAHWTFDEGRGSEIHDVAGKHHGVIKDATWTQGVRGGALYFDGIDDSVVFGNPDTLNLEGTITLSAWVKIESSRGMQNIVGHDGEHAEVHLRINQGLYQTGSWGRGVHMTAVAVPPEDRETWVHLVGSYDGQAWHLYRNGQLTHSFTTATGAVQTTDTWTIGAHTVRGRNFRGIIDEVRIYNRALSAEEVQLVVEEGLGSS